MQVRWLWFLVFVVMVVVGPLGGRRAEALPNDIHLHFLYEGKSPDLMQKSQQNFRTLATEFGFAVAEPVLSPAETLGWAGFDLGIEFTLADIPELNGHWNRVVEDERPDNDLFLTRLRFRKGLPFSFEIEGSAAFIYNSTAMLAGVGLKWSLNEGFYFFPDFAVRASVNRLFSSRDLDLMTVTVDFLLSKQFQLLGMLTLTPYAGYSLLFTNANSNVLDPTPKNFEDNETPESGNFVFEQEQIFGHRLFFGLRVVWFIMSLTFEGAFSLPASGQAETISMFNTKISFFF